MTAAEKRRPEPLRSEGGGPGGGHRPAVSGVDFARLGRVITDEQHRFGVAQRAALAAKGHRSPLPPRAGHVTFSSPTPLALIIYGDLDVSVIDPTPRAASRCRPLWWGGKRRRMYNFVRKQAGGRGGPISSALRWREHRGTGPRPA